MKTVLSCIKKKVLSKFGENLTHEQTGRDHFGIRLKVQGPWASSCEIPYTGTHTASMQVNVDITIIFYLWKFLHGVRKVWCFITPTEMPICTDDTSKEANHQHCCKRYEHSPHPVNPSPPAGCGSPLIPTLFCTALLPPTAHRRAKKISPFPEIKYLHTFIPFY